MLTQAWHCPIVVARRSFTLSATRGNPITILRWDAVEPLRDGEFDTAFWGLVSRRGQRDPLANGQNSSWVAKLTVDKTVGSSLTGLGSCRETGTSHWDARDR